MLLLYMYVFFLLEKFSSFIWIKIECLPYSCVFSHLLSKSFFIMLSLSFAVRSIFHEHCANSLETSISVHEYSGSLFQIVACSLHTCSSHQERPDVDIKKDYIDIHITAGFWMWRRACVHRERSLPRWRV